ncbi:hypothetical protein MGU_06086 [Metarhizium guizhouense ARSEF 977]|uniref:Uncharacterized protein n=1 Tax=Metarhizium guizhouense (strain ARSEF 977) TaxID=1276136 RepID=A0A0B4H4K0_METGA|nr:hypothetical protein MGU_06086 [Metarhizium guizhouense ARSEF 977]
MQLQTQTWRELENPEDPSAKSTPFFHDAESDDPEAVESTIDDYDNRDSNSYEDDDGAEDDSYFNGPRLTTTRVYPGFVKSTTCTANQDDLDERLHPESAPNKHKAVRKTYRYRPTMTLPEAFSRIAMSDLRQLIDLWPDLGMPEPRQVPARVSEEKHEYDGAE